MSSDSPRLLVVFSIPTLATRDLILIRAKTFTRNFTGRRNAEEEAIITIINIRVPEESAKRTTDHITSHGFVRSEGAVVVVVVVAPRA